MVDRVLEVVGDQPAEQPAASVGRAHRDVRDHPQRERVAAGVDRLVPARVRRHRDRAGADPRLGEPGPADRHVVGAHVLQPGGPEVVVRPGVLEPALQALDPAGHPRIGGVALLADVEDREFEVGVLVRVGHPAKLPSRFDGFGEQLFTEVMANTGTIPWERVRRAGAKLTTPLHPDDYLRLINPLWSSRELRGRIEQVIPETDDAATLVIRPGWGWRYDHRPGQYVGIGVQVEGRFQWRSYSVSSPPQARPRHHRDHRARDAGGPALRPPGQGPGAGHDRAPGAAGGRLRAARTRRRSGCCSWSAAAGSRR